MKRFLAISCSASVHSSNTQLLRTMAEAFQETYTIEVMEELWLLPLFSPQLQEIGIPMNVKELRHRVKDADAVIFSTPEYLHNIPAVLKNALEWMTTSGELADKPVLAITFTPAAPRGEYAMRSLLQSLKASKARVVAELPLYRNELRAENGTIQLGEDTRDILREALSLL